jgi:hypothetical protein
MAGQGFLFLKIRLKEIKLVSRNKNIYAKFHCMTFEINFVLHDTKITKNILFSILIAHFFRSPHSITIFTINFYYSI